MYHWEPLRVFYLKGKVKLNLSTFNSTLGPSVRGYTCLECNGGPTFSAIQQWPEALHVLCLGTFHHGPQKPPVPLREQGKGENRLGALAQ